MSTIPYRPAIDGLRAIAVTSVVLYHMNPTLLSGGFIGVDVFFVISGFLLTRIIYQKHSLGSFSYGSFYQRRIARLFPVLFLVTAFILVIAKFVYLPQDYASVGALALSSVLSVSNVKLTLMGSYFEISEDAVPFLHFWSLSLEEQFYLFLPLVIGLLFRYQASIRESVAWLSVLALISFSVSLILSWTAPRFAFYLLPTRAWELLVGSLLALTYFGEGSHRLSRLSPLVKPIGAGLVLLSFVFISGTVPFPGWIAVAPVLGTLMLLLEPSPRGDYIERALAYRPLVWVGKLSYSIYLWHWPIFCFIDYGMYNSHWFIRMAMKVVLTASASVASFYLVEAPARDWINRQVRRPLVFAATVAMIFAISLVGYNIRQTFYLNASPKVISEGGIRINENGTGPNVALIGDSKGSMYGLTMRALADSLDGDVRIMSSAAGDPFIGSDQFNKTIASLKVFRPDVVVFGAAWSGKVVSRPDRFYTTLDSVLKYTNHIVLLTEAPVLPKTGSREYFRSHGHIPLREDDGATAKRASAEILLMEVEGGPISVIDVDSYFLQPDGTIMFTDHSGHQLFQDRTHLSPFGTQLVMDELMSIIISDHVERGL